MIRFVFKQWIKLSGVVALLTSSALPVAAQAVTGVAPARNARAASRATNLSATLQQAAPSAALRVFSAQAGGRKAGTSTTNAATITLDPATDLRAGETVTAVLSGTTQPHVWQFTTATSGGTGTFAGGSDLAVWSTPGKQALGDVNNDGHLDMLTLTALTPYSPRPAELSIGLGNGRGSFSPAPELTLAPYCSDLTLGDLDADGDLDVVVLEAGGHGALRVYSNDGSGHFAAASSFALPYPAQVQLADINADGNLDAVLLTDSNKCTTLLGTGTGGFTSRFDISFNSTSGLKLGDIDNDGDLDLLVTEYSRVNALRNNGAGRFTAGLVTELGPAHFPQDLVLGDLDGDGDLDWVSTGSYIVSQGTNSLRVRLNNGTGTFSGGADLVVGTAPCGLALADIDADGDLDLVASNDGGSPVGLVNLLLNNGAGTFVAAPDVPVGKSPRRVSLADVDNDGDVDLLTVNVESRTVSVRLNGPVAAPGFGVGGVAPLAHSSAVDRNAAVSATFTAALSNGAATQQSVRVYSQQAGGLKAGVSTVAGNTVSWMPTAPYRPGETLQATVGTAVQNAAGAGLAVPKVWAFTAAAAGGSGTFTGTDIPLTRPARCVVTSDLDADGDLDLLVGEYALGLGIVGAWLNDGAGRFTFTATPIPFCDIKPFITFDADNDGDLDVLSSCQIAPDVLSLWLNNGRGGFSLAPVAGGIRLPSGMAGAANGLAAGDVDGDGDLDVAVTSNGNTVSVRLNDGAGHFAGGTEALIGYYGTEVALTDVDNDGDLDIVAAHVDTYNRSPGVSIVLNEGEGRFTRPTTTIPFVVPPRFLLTGDFDGDHDVDFLVYLTESSVNPSGLWLNDGRGNFTQGPRPNLNINAYGAALADVDGDGDQDLLVPNVSGRGVCVGLNDGRGSFSLGSVTYPTVSYPPSGQRYTSAWVAYPGDFDGDGDLDFVSTSYSVGGAADYLMVRLNQNRPLASTSAAAGAFAVYPNPNTTGNAWQVRLATPAAHAQLTLYSVLGQCLRRQRFSGQTAALPVDALAPGTYLLEVRADNQAPTTQRLVVQ